VPAKIGNGDDPANNLYWGAAYGVKTFFKNSKDWKIISDVANPTPFILERSVLKHRSGEVLMVADAYRGKEIKQSTIDFLNFAADRNSLVLEVSTDSKKFIINAGGSSSLIVYVGHDGLMDFSLEEYPKGKGDKGRDAIILACASKQYFGKALSQTGANPVLWTTGLMAPESYVLKAAIDGWILNEGGEKIRKRAADAYNTYQRCGLRAALNLFASG
jgi:hypothetical protein